MQENKYTFGKAVGSWHGDRAQTVTFIVTDDCNLACKYCYITHKNCYTRMDFETARKFVDQLLTTDSMRYTEAIILDFIGGEPMLEAVLIDQIVDYFKTAAFAMNHDWYWNYRVSICTNGVNYSTEPVQKLIQKNMNKISVSISLDGIKEKHDMQRIFTDGSGSFDTIDKNVDFWLSQFSGSTKVTFASDDLPLLFESIIYLWDRGIKDVSSNVVFENVWKENDDLILEEQLKKLADYVIENELFDKGYHCSFFEESIGFPYSDNDFDQTFCGAGKMIALSPSGQLFPCLRYYGHSLNNHSQWDIGNIEHGVDMDKVRPFVLSTNRLQSDEECLHCDMATGCGFCQGYNYDESETGTNFHRVKYICKMHKARVRANEYFFSKLYNLYKLERHVPNHNRKSLYILADNAYQTYCCSENKNEQELQSLTNEKFYDALLYARHIGFESIVVHSKQDSLLSDEIFCDFIITHLVPASRLNEALEKKCSKVIPIYDAEDLEQNDVWVPNVILNVRQHEIEKLSEWALKLFETVERINVNFIGLDQSFNLDTYRNQLVKIGDYIISFYETEGKKLEFSVLTDRIFINKHDNCGAGDKSFVLSSTGKLYACTGFIDETEKESIGDVLTGITKTYDSRLYKVSHSNLCLNCYAYQCKNCVHINKSYTREINVSPSFQCQKGNIEKDISLFIEKSLNWNPKIESSVVEISLDPITVFTSRKSVVKGYYHTCV